jgi:DNA-binding MarR family transcriptional regulator
MDAVSFAMKRAHLGFERMGRKLLAGFDLTPARFDLLETIRDCRKEMTQAELRKRLGVVRSAVCELVAVLEKLGFLRRSRAEDKRTWRVELTKRGRRLAKAAYGALCAKGEATARVNQLLTQGHTELDPSALRYDVTGLCFEIARRCGNRVRRNRHLYVWDIAHVHHGTIPFV